MALFQIIAWNIYNHYMQLKNRELDEQMLKDLAMQSVPIPCSYCEHVNLVPIRFDQNNKFDCTKCKKDNAVYINVESSQITTPIELEQTIKVNER